MVARLMPTQKFPTARAFVPAKIAGYDLLTI